MQVYPAQGSFTSIAFCDTLNPPNRIALAGTATEGDIRFYAVMTDSLGSSVWSQAYGTLDRSEQMIHASDGNLFLLGYTTATATVDYRLMRLSGTGAQTGNWPISSATTADYGHALAEHPNGWLCIAGQAVSLSSGVSNATLIRISLQGQISWARTLNDGTSGEALALAGDSAIFVFATSDSVDSLTGYDIVAFRRDTLGLEDSTRRFSIPGEQVCRGALRLSDSLTIIVGGTRPNGSGARYWNMLVLATNDQLDSLWLRTFGGTYSDMALTAAPATDRDSGIVIAGWNEIPGTGQHRGVLLKISRSGDSLWSLLQPVGTFGEFRDVRQDSSYRYHIAGQSVMDIEHGLYWVTEADPHSPGPHPPMQFSLLAPNANDTIRNDSVVFIWETSADPDSGDTVKYRLSLSYDTLFADSTDLIFRELNDTRFVWHTDTDNVKLFWQVEAADRDSHIRVCRDQHRSFRLSVPDSTLPFSLTFPDSGRMLPNTYSAFRWQPARDPDPIDTVRYAIHFMTVDSEMTITGLRDTFITVNFSGHPLTQPGDTVTWYVTATSSIPPMTLDSRERWTFIVWTESSADPAQVPYEFALYPPYPNPFNAATVLRFSVDRTEDVRLDIFDVLGRHVTVLASGVHTPGIYSESWNTAGGNGDATSGMYFARLTAGSRQRTVKLLLLR